MVVGLVGPESVVRGIAPERDPAGAGGSPRRKDKHGVNVSLVLVKSSGETKEVSIKPGRLTIGRESHCHIRIPAASVSRKHCELLNDGSKMLLKDNNSSNGTFVNKTRIQGGRELSAGDVISIGPAIFVLKVDGEPETINADEVFAKGKPEEEAPAKGEASPSSLLNQDPDDSSMMDFDFDLDDDDDDDDQPSL